MNQIILGLAAFFKAINQFMDWLVEQRKAAIEKQIKGAKTDEEKRAATDRLNKFLRKS